MISRGYGGRLMRIMKGFDWISLENLYNLSTGLLMVAKVNRDKGFYGINPDGFSGSPSDKDLGHGVGGEGD